MIGVHAGLASSAEPGIKHFELKHRTAAEMVALIAPLIEPDGTARGADHLLVVKAPADIMAAITPIIANADRPRRRLRISVRQMVNAAGFDTSTNRLAEPGVGPPDDPGMENPQAADRTDDRRTSTRDRDDLDIVQQIDALEGQPAFIRTDRELPLANQSISGHGFPVYNSIEYRRYTTGFYVTARINGGQLALEVLHQTSRPDRDRSGNAAGAAVMTTVRGQLGRWIALATASNDAAPRLDFNTRHTRRRQDSDYALWIRVEERP